MKIPISIKHMPWINPLSIPFLQETLSFDVILWIFWLSGKYYSFINNLNVVVISTFYVLVLPFVKKCGRIKFPFQLISQTTHVYELNIIHKEESYILWQCVAILRDTSHAPWHGIDKLILLHALSARNTL